MGGLTTYALYAVGRHESQTLAAKELRLDLARASR